MPLSRPTVRDDLIEINDDLDVNYGVFKNDVPFRRPADAWRMWPRLEYTPPVNNPKVMEAIAAGVEWTCAEHVSLVINGQSTWTYELPDGGTFEHVWSYGDTTTSDGKGYLPFIPFTRVSTDDFTLCCVLQRRGRALGTIYNFEVVKAPKVLDRDVLFVHYATGARQKQTDYNLKAGDLIDIAAPDMAIVGWAL